MGLQPDDLTDAERVAMGIEGNVGILLSEVYSGGQAEIGNLRAGDAILQINGEQVSSQRQARLIVAAANPGDELELIGLRDGERFRTTVIAAERPVAPD
jgi:S1-C subfamily serine protease